MSAEQSPKDGPWGLPPGPGVPCTHSHRTLGNGHRDQAAMQVLRGSCGGPWEPGGTLTCLTGRVPAAAGQERQKRNDDIPAGARSQGAGRRRKRRRRQSLQGNEENPGGLRGDREACPCTAEPPGVATSPSGELLQHSEREVGASGLSPASLCSSCRACGLRPAGLSPGSSADGGEQTALL